MRFRICNAKQNEFPVLVHSSHFKDTCVTEPLWKLARLTAEEKQNWDNQAGWMYSWRVSHGHFHIASLSAFPQFLVLVPVFFLTSCWMRVLFFASDFVLTRTKKTQIFGVLTKVWWEPKDLKPVQQCPDFCSWISPSVQILHIEVIFRKKKVSCEYLSYSLSGEYVHDYMTLSPFCFLVKLEELLQVESLQKKDKNLLEGINCCHSYSWINYINSAVKLSLRECSCWAIFNLCAIVQLVIGKSVTKLHHSTFLM